MKKILILLIAVFLTGAAQAQINVTINRDPFITRSLTGKSIQKVYARTSGGSITVTGISSGEARLEVYVNPSNILNKLSKAEIQEILDDEYDLTISTDNNLLSVTAKAKDRIVDRRKQLSIAFKIFVPQNVSNDVGTSGGSISMSDLSGTQQFTTSGGSLNIDKLTGKINGKTSGGSITVSDSKDDINLGTSGGSIKADNCVGNIILSTSGGSLTLNGLKGTIKATTSGGSVHGDNINGELITHTSGGRIALENITASLDASTSGGSINVSIKEVGKYVKLNTSGGSVDLDIPGNKGLTLALRGSRIKTGNLTNFSGSKDDRNMNGTLNGGGIPIDVRASGSINLALR